MSLQAMLWVLKHSETTLGARLVLLALADNAHDDGTRAFPAVETIAEKARMTRSGAQKALRRLEADGHIRNEGKHPEYKTTIYTIVGVQGGAKKVGPSGGEPEADGGRTSSRQSGAQVGPNSQSTPQEERSMPDAAASDVDKLYAAYWEKVKKALPPGPIPPSLKRVAEKALKEYSVEELTGPALDGFLAWRSKKPGGVQFSDIFDSHFGGRPLHDHIAFWISQADPSQAVRPASRGPRVLSERDVKIHRAVLDVQRGHRSRDEDAVQQAQQAKEWLEGQGIAMVPRASDGYPTFPSLDRPSS